MDERFEKEKKAPSVDSVEIVEKRTYNARKRNVYTTVYEREFNGSLNKEAKELLLDFIETINSNRVANFELIEISYPKASIEVREIK